MMLYPSYGENPFQIRFKKIVLFTNPTRTINNSDLELWGNITHHDKVAQFANILKQIIGTLSDNIVNVYWLQNKSTTTTGPPAFLLWLQLYHQWFCYYVLLQDSIPGPANNMADICLHAWHHLQYLLDDTIPFPLLEGHPLFWLKQLQYWYIIKESVLIFNIGKE